MITLAEPPPDGHVDQLDLPKKIVDCMCPREVCKTCGKARERIVNDTSAFAPQAELAAHIKERRTALGISRDEVNGWFASVAKIQHYEATDKLNAGVPTTADWPVLKERLGLDDRFDAFVMGERKWIEFAGEYVKPDGRLHEFHGDGFETNESLANRRKITGHDNGNMRRATPTLGWSDCGHDNWRPGVVFDPFNNPAIEAAALELGRTYTRQDAMSLRYIVGDTRDITATIPDGSVDLIFTSPPFLALRSYLPSDHVNKHREIGSEPNPAAFIDVLLQLTAEWGRVLAPHGTLAVELGDTYSGTNPHGALDGSPAMDVGRTNTGRTQDAALLQANRGTGGHGWPLAKSLAGIPQLYMIALAYGINPLTGQPSPAGRWRVRNVIHWHRPNPPVGALGEKWRPATSTITVACRGQKRWFDLDAVRNTDERTERPRARQDEDAMGRDGAWSTFPNVEMQGGAPPLDWHTDGDLGVGHIILSTQPYAGSHYATFPMELPRKIIDCMCPRSVCRVCGVARERITEHQRIENGVEVPAGAPFKTSSRSDPRGVDSEWRDKYHDGTGGSLGTKVTTLGWTDCGHDNWRPGIVLDPFVGSGTTLAAAQDLGRDGLGVDIDPRNAWLARERCGLFLEVEEYDPPVVDVATHLL